MNFILCFIYLTVVLMKCSLAFPFIMTSIGTVPKSITRYQTSRRIPTGAQYQRTEPLFDSSNNRFDNLMFPDEQYIEQRIMKDSQSDDSSDLHPIYVLPPPNFQPIVYPISRADGVQPGAQVIGNKDLTINLSPRPYPYSYPHGFSSWLFGGMSGLQRGGFWEQLSSDLALHNPVKAKEPNRVVVYLKRTQPIGQPNWPSFPTFEAHSIQKETPNHQKNNNNNIIKSKLPVGLTSFFLGGMRGLSGRHWQMPPSLVSQVEFMPSDGKKLTDKEKKKNEYKPAIQFDDESDLYNIIKHD